MRTIGIEGLSPYEAKLAGVDIDVYWREVEAERRQRYIGALLRERAGAEARKDEGKMAAIDGELLRSGYEQPPEGGRKAAA